MAERTLDGVHQARTLAEEELKAVSGGTPEKIEEAKRELYDLFMNTNYPEVLDRDANLADLFYRLYSDWIEQKREWKEVQDRMKEEIMARYG